jgi:protein tyrosine/serine phosphatase
MEFSAQQAITTAENQAQKACQGCQENRGNLEKMLAHDPLVQQATSEPNTIGPGVIV